MEVVIEFLLHAFCISSKQNFVDSEFIHNLTVDTIYLVFEFFHFLNMLIVRLKHFHFFWFGTGLILGFNILDFQLFEVVQKTLMLILNLVFKIVHF